MTRCKCIKCGVIGYIHSSHSKLQRYQGGAFVLKQYEQFPNGVWEHLIDKGRDNDFEFCGLCDSTDGLVFELEEDKGLVV